MRKILIPTCPSCLDGGKVELIDVPHDAIGVFEPVPKGWEGRVSCLASFGQSSG
jgi:hypothetical protein